MEYHILFDASEKPFNWQFSLSGLILVTVFLFVFAGSFILRNSSAQKQKHNLRIIASGLGFAISLSWVALTFQVSYGQYRMCQEALSTGNFAVAEGVISNFQPSSNTRGMPSEQFTVNGITFKYKDSMVSCGYNKTTDGHSVIQNGAHVRVSYLPNMQNTILRLEMGAS